MDEIASLSFLELSQALQSRELSATQAVEGYLKQIEAMEPRINSYITVMGEPALAEAAECDRRLQGGTGRGPLEGVPVAIKDLIDVAGVPTTNGIGAWRGRTATADGVSVARLRAAGAIILGKLNMHECAMGGTNDNPHFGRCHNPWDERYIPGGSSGGSGASVAAGLCAGSLGTDNMGSVRIPAAFCGIAGLKPTTGLVSMGGMAQLSWSTATIGPMTRGVDGVAMMMAALAGDDPDSIYSTAPPAAMDFTLSAEPPVKGLRVGVLGGFTNGDPDPEITRAFEAALEVLKAQGAILRPVTVDDLHSARMACLLIIESEGGLSLASELDDPAQPISDQVRGMLDYGRSMPTAKLVKSLHFQTGLRHRVARLWDEVDILMAPTTPVAPFKFEDQEPAYLGAHMPLANLCGLPALSLPMGFNAAGLPLGLQIMGPNFADPLVLRVGKAYEQATGWHRQRPSLTAAA